MMAGNRSSGLRPSRRRAAASVPPNQEQEDPAEPEEERLPEQVGVVHRDEVEDELASSSACGGSGTIRKAIADDSTKPIPVAAAHRSQPGTDGIVLENMSRKQAAAD